MKKEYIILLILLFPFLLESQNSNLKIKVYGTGNTTGHIANMKIVNNTKNPVPFTMDNYYIPSDGKHQGYIIPMNEDPDLMINPGETTIPLNGFCTDIRKPPVGDGDDFLPFTEWIPQKQLKPAPKPGDFIDESVFKPKEEVPAPDALNPAEANAIELTYPGTKIKFPYKIDIDKHPKDAAPLLFEAINRITETFDSLTLINEINTPFSNNPKKEKESVIQQSFWIYTSVLTGDPYEKRDFELKMKEQFKNATGNDIERADTVVKNQFNDGINRFWDTFELVGEEAKVIKTSENDVLHGIGCKFICPPNFSRISSDLININWECKNNFKGPFELKIQTNKNEVVEIKGIMGTNYVYHIPEKYYLKGTDIEVKLKYLSINNDLESSPIYFNVKSDCFSEMKDIIKKLDSLWNIVQNAKDELNSNPLVKEAQTIELLWQISVTPDTILNFFNNWMDKNFSLPDLSNADSPQKIVNDICAKLGNIKAALGYGKMILKFMSMHDNKKTESAINRIDNTLSKLEDACANQEKFQQFYNELNNSISDIQGFLAGKMEEYVKDKIKNTLKKILVKKLGTAAAGSIMSAATDSWNYIDALIKNGNLAEAKKMYYLMYFRMLENAYNCQCCKRYHIDETWNSKKNGLPQVEWKNCEDVEGKSVVLEAVVNCWVQDKDGKINEGHFETKTIKFKGGLTQLRKDNFHSDCSDICAFQFQLDMDDLENNASGCDHAYVEIKITVDNESPTTIFGGVYNP